MRRTVWEPEKIWSLARSDAAERRPGKSDSRKTFREEFLANEAAGLLQDPLDSIKRKTYVTALLFGLPAFGLLWARSEFTDLLYPAIGLLFIWCIWALSSKKVGIKAIERIIFFCTAVFFLGQLVYGLFSGESLFGARADITENVFTTFTALYVAAYLIFDTRTGMRLSISLYALGLAVVVLWTIREGPANLSLAEVSWLLRMHAFMAAVIALLYTMAYAKEQLSRQRALSEAMGRLALTDQLTGISNRRGLYLKLERELEESDRYARPLCVILFDLDHFKKINDAHGHDRGDAVLKRTTGLVSPLLRGADHFGRWGGEEFILITPETDLEQAARLAERLRCALESVKTAPNARVGATASFGLSRHRSGDTPESIVKRADEALYDAKANGRNRVEVSL